MQARGAAAPSSSEAAVSQPGDPLEREADAFAEAFVHRVAEHPRAPGAGTAHAPGAPTAAVQPSPRAASLVQRDIVNDAAGHPVSYTFRIGVELDPSFAALAKRLLGGGTLHTRGLSALRQHALNRHGTVDDHERMFIAGLMVPANASILAAATVGPGTSVTFALSTITPNMPAVIDLGRQSVPASVSGASGAAADAAAEREIRGHAGAFGAQVSALLTFASGARVSLPDLLRAMLAAASDSSAGDRVMAGAVYAIAVAAGHAVAGEVLSGTIKVDGLLPAVFRALPIPVGVRAFYVTAAQGSGLKGDTIYMPTDLDISDLHQRSLVIHELQHARDDRATTGVQFQQANQLEENGYRAQGRFLLEQMAAQTPADRTATAVRLAGQANPLELLGMVIEALGDRPRFEPLIAAIAAASHPPVPAADVATLLNRGMAALQTTLRARITAAYRMSAGQVGVVDGLSGDSILDWIFRI